MLNRLVLALALVVVFTGAAWALPVSPGTYDMEWAVLHTPVSSDLPDLTNGVTTIQLESATTASCPPTSAFVIKNAPASAVEGGVTTWCIKSDGTFDTSASGNGDGVLVQYTADLFYVEADNHRANDRILAVGRRQTTPQPGTLKVFITAPHNGDTVSGTVWVVLWVDGTSGTGNGAHVVIRDSVVSGNVGDGVLATSAPGKAPAFIVVGRTSSVNNAGNGILANGPHGTVLVADSIITRNGTGISAVNSGQLISYGNNRVNNNLGPDGTPTGNYSPI